MAVLVIAGIIIFGFYCDYEGKHNEDEQTRKEFQNISHALSKLVINIFR